MSEVVDAAGQTLPARTLLRSALKTAEADTLRELELVREPLQLAVRSVIDADPELASRVSAGEADFDRRYGVVHDELLTLIARQAPVAGDLRLAMALIHVNDRVERIAAQCLNIATLCCAVPGGQRPPRDQLECLESMSRVADEQLAETGRVFAERDVKGASELRARDKLINECNRECFWLAVAEGGGPDNREAAFFIALMARAIERIGDNAVDIGQQAVFVATGNLRRTPAPTG
jgi:phosphate transport system protein